MKDNKLTAENGASGMSWLSNVPPRWNLVPLGNLFRERRERNRPLRTQNILSLVIGKGVIPYAEKGAGGNKAKEDMTEYYLAYKGDIVLNSMNVIEGAVGVSNFFGAVSPVYHVLFPATEEIHLPFYGRVFENKMFQRSLIRLGKGILIKKSGTSDKLNTIRMRISISQLKRETLPRPPLPEQKAIAKFLDQKTALIDQAISQKERLIELLKELKQIIIQNAVTKGLDPNVKMKDSGVEWIGEIPEHWEVRRLKYVSKDLQYGTSVDCNTSDAGIPVLRIPNIGDQEISTADLKYADLPDRERARYLLKKGDLLIIRTNGNPALVGKCAVFQEDSDFAFASYLIRIRATGRVRSRFLLQLLNAPLVGAKLTEAARTTVGNYNINTEGLSTIPLTIPPLAEQDRILEYLSAKMSSLQNAILLQTEQIEKLKEYRTILIDAAVTGKIKVTND